MTKKKAAVKMKVPEVPAMDDAIEQNADIAFATELTFRLNRLIESWNVDSSMVEDLTNTKNNQLFLIFDRLINDPNYMDDVEALSADKPHIIMLTDALGKCSFVLSKITNG